MVRQRIKRTYDSAIASFCAAKATDVNPEDDSIMWKFEGDVSGIFSKLIYYSQLLILQQAENLVNEGGCEEIGDALEPLCRKWILNNTRSPVSTMNDWRLYSIKVASSTVPPAPIIWDDDGQILTFRDLRYSITDLATEICFCLREAQAIFHQELCLGFDRIPIYPLHELQDNWACRFPGYSFVDDSRNATYFEGHAHWLSDRIAQHDGHRDIVFHTEQTDHEPGQWPVRSEFVKQYQISVEKFLELLLVLVHIGSGQPAHRTEFLGMLWRNTSLAVRNIRLFSGYVVFILTYFKSQSRTHGSRAPVRVVFPPVAQLLVQFLVLIEPFRGLLARDTNIPPLVGDYLWSSGEAPWSDERMTRVLRSTSRRSIGRERNVQAWRQICVALAVKKFSGMRYEADTDIPGNDDDCELDKGLVTDGVTLPVSFHAQAVHSTRTGNRAYGGSINFSSSLTDAGVQVYLWTSKLWWTLFERQVQESISGKRARSLSMSETPSSSSLIKRVAHQTRTPRHLRRWGSETVAIALKRLYRQPDAGFRSPIQRHMVEVVATGYAEVIIIVATGGGKSLSFLVPICFPQAGTTVVVVPLVALKSDLVRRCWEADIQYSIWTSHGDHQRYTGTPLLFVSAEQTTKQPFRHFLSGLDANRQLDRIVFDESHLILTASEYRPKMALLRYLRELRCQVVFLSATLPPIMMAQFQARMLLHQPQIIRDVTFRTDLFYNYHRQSQAGNFEEYMVKGIYGQIQGLAPEDRARVIVYVNRKEEARAMAARLGCEYYYSDSGTAEDKEQVVARWRNGEHRVIIATSAFGTGVDYAHVRCVIHQGLPRDAVNFAQEVGRLGRDGHGGSSHVIVPYASMPIDDRAWQQQKHTTLVSERVMQRYVSQSRCLWATLSRFVDGIEKMQYCREGESRHLCGICQSRGAFVPSEEEDVTQYWDLEVSTWVDGTGDAGQDRRREEDEVSTSEEGSVDETPNTLAALQGSQRLRAAEQRDAEGYAQYVERCRRWKGTCLICQLLRGGQGVGHTLDTCRRVDKWRFIRAKEAAVKGRRGWMKDHVACWSCGQLPALCDGLRGVKGCEFRDMVLPGSWAMFQMGHLWGWELAAVAGQEGGFRDEREWMQWIGQECEVFGERGIHGVRMLGWVLERMEEGALAEPAHS
jgi:superfamily II DNA helicase RecQ